jgi:hypothetical protein
MFRQNAVAPWPRAPGADLSGRCVSGRCPCGAVDGTGGGRSPAAIGYIITLGALWQNWSRGSRDSRDSRDTDAAVHAVRRLRTRGGGSDRQGHEEVCCALQRRRRRALVKALAETFATTMPGAGLFDRSTAGTSRGILFKPSRSPSRHARQPSEVLRRDAGIALFRDTLYASGNRLRIFCGLSHSPSCCTLNTIAWRDLFVGSSRSSMMLGGRQCQPTVFLGVLGIWGA